MKFDIDLERVFPQTVEQVWKALTDRNALGAWLMETDFVAQAGHSFKMWCNDGAGGTDVYFCRVLELEKHKSMLWSWLRDGDRELGETFVEFTLTPVENGTRLTIRHRGDLPAKIVENFKSGWPGKMDRLEHLLSES